MEVHSDIGCKTTYGWQRLTELKLSACDTFNNPINQLSIYRDVRLHVELYDHYFTSLYHLLYLYYNRWYIQKAI
ncbi:hypothetical protein D3C73_1242790 [compost metagenome]